MAINEEWQKINVKKLSPKQMINLLEHDDIYILDVRPLNFERDKTFIKGSALCPLVYLIDRYVELPTDRQIIITDWAMKQSPTAAKFLVDKGYSVVGVLKGGLERWKEEGWPVEEKEVMQELPSLNAQEKN